MFLKIKKGLLAFLAVAITATACLLGAVFAGKANQRAFAEDDVPEGAFAMLEIGTTKMYYSETSVTVASGSYTVEDVAPYNLSTVFKHANGYAEATAENPAKITVLANRKATTTATLTVEAGKFIDLDLNGYKLDFKPSDGTTSSFSPITINGTFTLRDGNPAAAHALHKYNVITTGLYEFVDEGLNTLYGGVITGGNTQKGSSSNGGGCIYVSNNSKFIMESGTLAGNHAAHKGGAVYVNGGTFEMRGGAIEGNVSGDSGAGVYMSKSSKAFIISGPCKISGNSKVSGNSKTDDNVNLNSESKKTPVITIGGNLTANGIDANIGLTPDTLEKATYANFYGDGTNSYNEGKTISDYFHLDGSGVDTTNGNYEVIAKSGTQDVVSQRYTTIDLAWNTAKGVDGSIVKIYADAETGTTLEADGGNITLDLGGNTLKYTGAEGAVVKVSNNGTFTLEGSGTISGGKEGGVNVAAGTFTMNGGAVTGNEGGGVNVAEGSTFNVSGAANVTGNTQNDVYLEGNNAINVTGALTQGAQIGVNNTGKIATGYEQSENPSVYFITGDSANDCVYAKSGEVNIGAHTGGTATCTEKAECVNCLEPYGADPQGHQLQHIIAKDATCTEDGNREYWHCSECNKNFGNSEGTAEITGNVTIPQTGHSPAADYTHNEVQHYKICGNCNEQLDKGNHDTNSDGACSVCGYKAVVGHVHNFVEVANESYRAKAATCTEKATYYKSCEGEGCDVVSEDTFEYGELAPHDIKSIVILTSPAKKSYTAFDTFDKTGMIVKTHCASCDNDIETIEAYSVKYKNGDCLHAGDTYVAIVCQIGDDTLETEVDGLTVEAKSTAIKWQYNTSATGTPNWVDFANNKYELTYSPNNDGLKSNVRALFTDGNGDGIEIVGTNTFVLAMKNSELQTKIVDAGEYILSLDVDNTDFIKEYGDYEFTNNEAALTINPAPIEINNRDVANFFWRLEGYDSALRSGYIDTRDYKYYSEAGTHRKEVIASIVRDRQEEVTISLYGARSDEGIYNIIYDEGCTADTVGEYTAHAKLTLTSKNYFFRITGTPDARRQMTVEINDDGSVDITKVWYIAQIDNGLLSQQKDGTYGKEWSFTGWIYGVRPDQYAPRLEHGDPGEINSVKTFEKDDNLVTFELFRTETEGTVNRVKMGNTFNRYEFENYINSSLPAGKYVLAVHVGSYTSEEHNHWYDTANYVGEINCDGIGGVYYDSFDREFIFEVTKSNLQSNISLLEGKSFSYTYDGKMHLFDDTFTLNTQATTERKGEWAKADYDSYYGKAEILYHLSRWNNEAFVTESRVAAYNNERQKPQGVDTYTVYFKLSAPNYVDYGGKEKFFTVVINKADYDMSGVKYEDLEATYDGTVKNITVSGLPKGVTYKVEGRTNAGSHRLVVLFSGDSVNYNPIEGVGVTLVIHKAHVAVPDTRTATLEGGSYTYVPDSSLYEVVGNATFTQAGDHEITLRLKDANNYAWNTADGELTGTTVKTVLSLKAAEDPDTPVNPNPKPDEPNKPVTPDTDGGENKVDVWLILSIIMGVVIAVEVVTIVVKLIRKNKNTEAAE